MEYSRLSRNVTVKNEVYLNLVKQYEQNKIQEAMDSMDIQIIDPANLPDEDRPVTPKKKLIALIGGGIGIILSALYSVVLMRRMA